MRRDVYFKWKDVYFNWRDEYFKYNSLVEIYIFPLEIYISFCKWRPPDISGGHHLVSGGRHLESEMYISSGKMYISTGDMYYSYLAAAREKYTSLQLKHTSHSPSGGRQIRIIYLNS